MSWSMIQSLFDGQGIVFWAAVSAVTLGLTMLSVSIVFQVRKMVSGTQIRFKRPALKKKPQITEAQATPRITVTGDVYQADGYLPESPLPATGPTTADPLLTNLLDRLKSSADRLENIHASLGNNMKAAGANPDSALKETSVAVDYVYRTGRA